MGRGLIYLHQIFIDLEGKKKCLINLDKNWKFRPQCYDFFLNECHLTVNHTESQIFYSVIKKMKHETILTMLKHS